MAAPVTTFAAAAAHAAPAPSAAYLKNCAALDAYELVREIGSGSFGRISQIRRKSDGMILACKEVSFAKMSEKEKMQLVSEVNILRELRHPNIVRYYERIIDKENYKIYIIMEFCNGGDLTSIIRRLQQERCASPLCRSFSVDERSCRMTFCLGLHCPSQQIYG